MGKIYIGAGLAAGICVGAIAAGEVNDFTQPSDMVCFTPPPKPDFGMPVGCGDAPQPHSRSVFGQAITTASSTTAIVSSAVVVFDADYVRIVDHVGQLPQRGRYFPF